MLSIPYQGADPDPKNKHQLRYYPNNPKARALDATVLDDEEVLYNFSKYKFPSEGSFVPDKMEVRERNGQSSTDETKRIIILGHDRLHYKVFRLPISNYGMREVDEDIPMS